MEDRRISDSQITASSEWSPDYGPTNARLTRPADGSTTGSWVARTNDLLQWIQVDFSVPKMVSGIMMQGREGYYQAQCVTRYRVEYKNGGTTWLAVRPMNYLQQPDQMVRIKLINMYYIHTLNGPNKCIKGYKDFVI